MQVGRSNLDLEILATDWDHGQARRWPCAWHSLCGRCLTEQAGDDCQQDVAAVRQQWRIETSHLYILLCLHSPDKTSARASSPAEALCTTHHPRRPIVTSLRRKMPEKATTIATYAAGASLAAITLVYVFGPTFFLDDEATSASTKKKGVVGLSNAANDCFSNSVLQALAG